MYTIQKIKGDVNIYRVFLHEDCELDIHSICLDLLPMFDEGRGAEYIVESKSVATIATL